MQLAITVLKGTDRARIQAHLLRLRPEDRSLRFSAGLVTDETIRRYVAGIRFDDDLLMGLVDERDLLVGLVHGCVYPVRTQTHIEAAFSLDAEWRGHGFGTRLMGALQARAGTRAGVALVGICAARNLKMRRIFEHAGMALTREEDEIHAYLPLQAEDDRQLAALAA